MITERHPKLDVSDDSVRKETAMAVQDNDRTVPRELEKDRSTPTRSEGISWAGYAFLAFIVGAVAIVGYSIYGLNPPSAPNKAPANERQIVNPPTTTTPR